MANNYSERKEFRVPGTWMEMITGFICRDGVELTLPEDPIPDGKDSRGVPMVLIYLEGNSHWMSNFCREIVKTIN